MSLLGPDFGRSWINEEDYLHDHINDHLGGPARSIFPMTILGFAIQDSLATRLIVLVSTIFEPADGMFLQSHNLF